MRLRRLMVPALLVLLLSAAGWSYPVRFGAVSGLVDLPTSDVALSGGGEFAVDYARLENDQQVWPVRLVLGVSEGAELGISYARLKDTVDDDFTGFGAKMRLMQAPESPFDLGVGASFLDSTGRDILDIYAVASAELGAPGRGAYQSQAARARMRGHLGIMFTRISAATDDDELKPFLGFDVTTPEGTTFVAEYKFTKFGDDHAAAAIRYPLSPALTAQVGVARAGTVLGMDDYRFLVGVNYNFATPETRETPY